MTPQWKLRIYPSEWVELLVVGVGLGLVGHGLFISHSLTEFLIGVALLVGETLYDMRPSDDESA